MEDRITYSTDWMTRRYALALTVIALLACSAYAAFEMVIRQQESTGAVVNISGRQRMLSQRTALFVQRMLAASDHRQYQLFSGKLRHATSLLEVSHKGLTMGNEAFGLPDEMSETVRRMYFEGKTPLDTQMRQYIAALKTVIGTKFGELSADTAEVKYILEAAPGPLLESLDLMVWQYQIEGEQTVTTLHRLETAVLALVLFTLMVEAVLIFRPMVKQAQAQIASISHISDALRKARDSLEEQVEERTQELQEAKDTAERANVAKSRFLAAASHDLSQPLEAIGMFTGMLDRVTGDDRVHTILNDLRGAQRSMRTLLGSLIEISKLEVGAIEPKARPVHLTPMIRQLAAEYWPQAMSRNLTLRVTAPEATVVTDPTLLERILRNFLSNALRYTHRGGVLLGCRRRGNNLRIEVYDTGPGIPEEERSRIFEEFSQLDDPDRDRSEGIGLGLAISDRLASLLEHPLEVRSTVGKGSRFSVSVPIGATAPPQERPAS